MLTRPSNNANEEEVLNFAQRWIALASEIGFETALASLDPNPRVPWTQALFEELTFNHFGDDKYPKITSPSDVRDLRVDAYRYNDESGFAVDHDLPLDGKRSDFTAQFDFRKGQGQYRVYLEDIHIL